MEEYQTELGVEILERLLEADYKSAKDVLEANIDDICKKTEIEKEKVEQIIEIIRKGYEEAENEVDENKPAE